MTSEAICFFFLCYVHGDRDFGSSSWLDLGLCQVVGQVSAECGRAVPEELTSGGGMKPKDLLKAAFHGR